MAAEIINLNKIRKANARAEKERAAAQNRARFGRSKSDRRRGEAESARAESALDGAKRSDGGYGLADHATTVRNDTSDTGETS